MSKHEIEMIGTKAVKILRQKRLRDGLPFMINDEELPPNQCYLEHPDGPIQLVSINKTRNGFKVIRDLFPFEQKNLRKRYGLA